MGRSKYECKSCSHEMIVEVTMYEAVTPSFAAALPCNKCGKVGCRFIGYT